MSADHEAKSKRATTRALAAEERLRLLVDSVEDYGIFMLDIDGRVETWNSGAHKLKGYTADEIIGKSIATFYPPEDVASGKPQKLLARARSEGRVADEGWRVRKDGTLFWADVVISAVRNDDGELIGFSKVTRDLTEKRAAAEAVRRTEEHFRLLVESVKDHAIFMLDPKGIVISWNAGAEAIKGYRANEIIGSHFSRFYPRSDVEAGKCEMELEGALRIGRFEDEGWRIRKDGTRFWANVVITRVLNSDGVHVGFAKVTRDLTVRRLAEEERVRLAQAQEAIRLRDEFLSIASHELKTPLTAMQLQLESLRRRVDASEDKVLNKLDSATRSGERLADLIEMLLDVSRIATGRLSLQVGKFDIGDVLTEMIERLSSSAAKNGCTLTTRAHSGVIVKWDQLRTEQVISNLVSNAIKYGRGAPVEVTMDREGDDVVLSVSDHGPGIPAEDLTRIFGRFERAASASHYGGMGLGLYVTREIVEAHGGEVRAENLPEGGARFTVRMPLEPQIEEISPDSVH